MRFEIELQICVFGSQKRMALLSQSKSIIPTGNCSIGESDDPSRRIVAQNSTSQVIRFSIRKNGMLSKFKMLSMTAHSSYRTIDELDGDRAV